MKNLYLLEITMPDGQRHFFKAHRATWASARSWQKRIQKQFPGHYQSGLEVVDDVSFTPALNLAFAEGSR